MHLLFAMWSCLSGEKTKGLPRLTGRPPFAQALLLASVARRLQLANSLNRVRGWAIDQEQQPGHQRLVSQSQQERPHRLVGNH